MCVRTPTYVERLLEYVPGGVVAAAAAQIVLGDLQPQRARVQPGLVEDLAQVLDEARLARAGEPRR